MRRPLLDDPSPKDLTRPASEMDVRRAYLDATSMGYAIAGVGAVTALIGTTLALGESEEGLHAVGLALGLLAAGLITDRLDRHIGTARVHLGALVLLALAVLALAWSPALVVTLLGAAGVGLGFGIMFSHVNQTLAAGGGSSARVRLARATLIAQVSSLTVPLVIWIGEEAGIGWGFVALPVLVTIGLSLVFTRGRNYRPIPVGPDAGNLPRAYWTAWLFVLIVNAFEWTIIFWASTLVEQQTGVSLGTDRGCGPKSWRAARRREVSRVARGPLSEHEVGTKRPKNPDACRLGQGLGDAGLMPSDRLVVLTPSGGGRAVRSSDVRETLRPCAPEPRRSTVRLPMQPRRGLQFLAAALAWAAILLPAGAAAVTRGGAVLAPATEGAQASLSETLVDEEGPYATRTRGADGRWLMPSGDAVLIDEAWWTPLRPLGDRAIEPVEPDQATVRGVRATVAPAAGTRVPDRLDAVALGDVTANGQMDLVVSFRRPFRETLINSTRSRRFWTDGYGDSAHLGLYRPGDLRRIWVAGTLVAPVVELAACDGALAVAYGRHRRPGIVETGAWRWVVFGFLPTEPLPGTGTPICVDIDGDGQSEPAIIGRSTR